jgi:hypothetical protein
MLAGYLVLKIRNEHKLLQSQKILEDLFKANNNV